MNKAITKPFVCHSTTPTYTYIKTVIHICPTALILELWTNRLAPNYTNKEAPQRKFAVTRTGYVLTNSQQPSRQLVAGINVPNQLPVCHGEYIWFIYVPHALGHVLKILLCYASQRHWHHRYYARKTNNACKFGVGDVTYCRKCCKQAKQAGKSSGRVGK